MAHGVSVDEISADGSYSALVQSSLSSIKEQYKEMRSACTAKRCKEPSAQHRITSNKRRSKHHTAAKSAPVSSGSETEDEATPICNSWNF